MPLTSQTLHIQDNISGLSLPVKRIIRWVKRYENSPETTPTWPT